MKSRTAWALLIVVNALCYGVLSFQGTSEAQQRTAGELPFANSVEQRAEMVQQLREIKELLREQNALLRSGNLRVVVTLPEKR
jgi:hypothetical protein